MMLKIVIYLSLIIIIMLLLLLSITIYQLLLYYSIILETFSSFSKLHSESSVFFWLIPFCSPWKKMSSTRFVGPQPGSHDGSCWWLQHSGLWGGALADHPTIGCATEGQGSGNNPWIWSTGPTGLGRIIPSSQLVRSHGVFLWLINDINGGYQNHFRSGMIFSKGNESISYLLESKVNDSSWCRLGGQMWPFPGG